MLTNRLIVVGDYIPPDVCVETSTKRMRGILETTRQNSRPLVELCFLFVGIHVIKSDGLTNVLNWKLGVSHDMENSRHPMKKPADELS